ncbi:MAG: universal stress protein [Deltaproteobacteria bacterium]|nr:universal stress protein [Deltaproteobacteria bacterium]
MISKILLPVDGSERSREAVRYAISLAKQTKASLHLFNVVEEQVASLSSENDINSFLNAAVAYLLEMEKEIKEQGIPVSKAAKIGNPAAEIVKEAQGAAVDLIVMASHGRTVLQSALLGSVSAAVIHHEQAIPVLIVRQGVKIH